MTVPDQLVLAFDHRPAHSGEDFLIAPENHDAVAWIDRWPDWPSPFVVIHGPPGCGKSHLCEVFRAKTGAARLGPDLGRFVADQDAAPAFVFDDLDRHLGVAIEEAVFHLYNRLLTDGRHLVATARTAPVNWPFATEDVRSRVQSSPAAVIAPPGDELVAGVLVKLFQDHQLAVGSDVILYLVRRMERSFDAARRFVEAIDRASLAGKRRVTVPLVRDILATPDG